MSATDAKRVLRHYLVPLLEANGARVDSDVLYELDSIVDNIVDAAVSEVMSKLASEGVPQP